MHAITIGPLILPGDRLAVFAGIGVLLIVTAFLAKRIDRDLERGTNTALIVGLIAARLGHVIAHAPSFAAEPWRIFAVWQGGFSLWWGVAGGVTAGMIRIHTWRSRLWAVFALWLSLWVWMVFDRLTSETTETSIPVQTFERLDGSHVALVETGGKPAVINLWASWCPPCRREMPTLVQASKDRHDVRFLFVNQGESREKIAAYLSKEELAPDNVLLDPLGDVAHHYGTPGLPTTLFVGSDGRLRSTHVGQISPEELDEQITIMEQAENTKISAKK
jgi:thiol-disulfide isomerase/thioredoxin